MNSKKNTNVFSFSFGTWFPTILINNILCGIWFQYQPDDTIDFFISEILLWVLKYSLVVSIPFFLIYCFFNNLLYYLIKREKYLKILIFSFSILPLVFACGIVYPDEPFFLYSIFSSMVLLSIFVWRFRIINDYYLDEQLIDDDFVN